MKSTRRSKRSLITTAEGEELMPADTIELLLLAALVFAGCNLVAWWISKRDELQ
jgi:hypothetical protein